MNCNYIDEIDFIEREAEMDEVLNEFDFISQQKNETEGIGEAFLKDDIFNDNISEMVKES